MLEQINYTFQNQISLVNPNSWLLSDFNPPIINGTSYTCISKTHPERSIFIPVTSYPKQIGSNGKGIVNLFDITQTYGYVGLPYPNNYLIINGISGLITGMKITYWGDYVGNTLHIASKVTLFSDNSQIGIICTRSSSPNDYTDNKRKYTLSKNVVVYNKLKMLFENIPSGDGGEALPYRIEFTMKSV